MNQSELELLGRYIAAQYHLIDGKVEVALLSGGKYRFQGFAQVNSHFQVPMVVHLEDEAARKRVARLLCLEELAG